MQSILTTSPTKIPNSEVKNDTTTVESVADSEQQNTEKKEALPFSSVLDSFTAKELKTESDLLGEGDVEDSNTEPTDKIVSDENIDDKLTNAEIELKESESVLLLLDNEGIKKESNHSTTLLTDDAAETGKKELESDELFDKEGTDLIQEELVTTPKTLNPILAKIEIAQKTDTNVNESKNTKQAAISLKEASKESKESGSVFKNMTKVTAENALSDELQLKEVEGSANKLNNITSAVALETDKPIFNLNQESNSLRSVAISSASPEKLLNQATQNTPLMQSTALQQPIEVQSKHASSVMGERIMMMINQGKQEVTIRLDPAELGSMNIKLQVQQDQLHVSIQTQVGQSRDIIEQNLPRLREQLAQQGINLGEANVEQQSKQEQSQSQHSSAGSAVASHVTDKGSEVLLDDQSEWLSTQIPFQAQGIDYYA